VLPSLHVDAPRDVDSAGPLSDFSWMAFAPALAGYAMFGLGYIGYMTFVIALLREQGVGPARVTFFYALLGLAVLASSRIWAGVLDRYRGGEALALLNGLVGAATLIPALTNSWPWVLLSGLVFGGVFLSVVASTTALVRHNLAPTQWAAGISAFTIVFAAGQIVGPTIVGWIADGPGGLARGLVFSACALWAGAVLAWRQRPLELKPC
jgi:predicted MFS family arabinose efflux permease